MEFEILPPVPAVLTARQLRQIPLFAFASVDELFRFSTIARQVRHPKGSTFQRKGAPARYIQVLLEGKALVSEAGRCDEAVHPPALLGFREVLEEAPLEKSVCAGESSICLAMEAEEFRTLISDNIELAGGLFRMLLDAPARYSSLRLMKGAVSIGSTRRMGIADARQSTRPIDKALLLQDLPIFSRATAEELFHLAGITREVELVPGQTLFGEGDSPSIWVVMEGEISLEQPDSAESEVASPGDVLGIAETLAGRPPGRQGQARRPGRALRIEREIFFDLLSNRVGLLQGMFGSLFQSGPSDALRNS